MYGTSSTHLVKTDQDTAVRMDRVTVERSILEAKQLDNLPKTEQSEIAIAA